MTTSRMTSPPPSDLACHTCNRVISSSLLKSASIFHCSNCSTSVYCSLKCRDLDPFHEEICTWDWNWFWEKTAQSFGENYMRERQFKCSVWNLLCMMICNNDMQRSIVYKELCCLQPVHPRIIASLLEEDLRVSQNDTFSNSDWRLARKVVNHWNRAHSSLPYSIENGQPIPYEDDDRLDAQNIIKTFNFWRANKWFFPLEDVETLYDYSTKQDIRSYANSTNSGHHTKDHMERGTSLQQSIVDVTGDPVGSWEKRDWKILGGNIIHLQIGDWSADRCFEYQFRLRVNIDMKALEYHIFNHKSMNWKEIGDDIKRHLLGESKLDQNVKCKFFINDLNRFQSTSRHIVIYVPFENIESLRAHGTKIEKIGNLKIVTLTLNQPPRFFEEIHKSYRYQWIETNDITNRAASTFNNHFILLEAHEYNKIIPLILQVAGENSPLCKNFELYSQNPEKDANLPRASTKNTCHSIPIDGQASIIEHDTAIHEDSKATDIFDFNAKQSFNHHYSHFKHVQNNLKDFNVVNRPILTFIRNPEI